MGSCPGHGARRRGRAATRLVSLPLGRAGLQPSPCCKVAWGRCRGGHWPAWPGTLAWVGGHTSEKAKEVLDSMSPKVLGMSRLRHRELGRSQKAAQAWLTKGRMGKSPGRAGRSSARRGLARPSWSLGITRWNRLAASNPGLRYSLIDRDSVLHLPSVPQQ